jgi:hypothetical protein
MKNVCFWMSLLLMLPNLYAQDEAPLDTLDEVEVSFDEVYTKLQEMADFDNFMDALAAQRISKDERLLAFAEGFMERNYIRVFTLSLIQSERFWYRIFKNGQLRTLERQDPEFLLAAKIIFYPREEDYLIQLILEGRDPSTFDLLNVTSEDLQRINAQVNEGEDTTEKPGAARARIVDELIAALEELEATSELNNLDIPFDFDVDSIEEELKGLKRDPNILRIDMASQRFNPTEYPCGIQYTIKDTMDLEHKALLIYRLEGADTLLVMTTEDISYGIQLMYREREDEDQPPGWYGRDSAGELFPPGQYLIQLVASQDEALKNGFYDYWETEMEYNQINGLSRRPDLLVIHSVNESFDPSSERLNIHYSLIDTMKLRFSKLEIFATSDPSKVITFYTDLAKGRNIDFRDSRDGNKTGWSGILTNNAMIEEGEYQLKITASTNSNFVDGFVDHESFIVSYEKYYRAPIDSVNMAATEAVAFGTSFVGDETTAACNICTRAAVYISTGRGETTLYPEKGSHIGDTSSAYLKGDVTDPGKANNIYKDLNEHRLLKFSLIPDMEGEDYPDFEKLQEATNEGQIIIGSYYNDSGSGHVVMLVPGSTDQHYNWSSNKVYQLSNKSAIKFPNVLECGSNHREHSTPAYDNISINKLKEMRWYKLIK